MSAGSRRRHPAGLGAALALAALAWAPAAESARWSAPASLTSCASASQPRVVFPSADPRTSSGPGAILWRGDPASCGAAGGGGGAGGPGGSGVGLAAIGAGDLAGPAQSLRLSPGPAAALEGLDAAAATGDGRIVIAAGLGSEQAGRLGALEGRADAPFGRPTPLRAQAAPVASATSYLGEVALATVGARTGRVELRLQRPGALGLSVPLVLSRRGARVSALAVGLDYRGDALVVWEQGGWIYRGVLRVSGKLEPAERIALSPPAPHLQALISDDDRGIVAWTGDENLGGASVTRVYLDASRAGVHFGPPRLVERFRNPPGLHLPDGSLRLVRLASEGVMMAWTGIDGGRYVVRAATVSLDGLRPASLISGPAAPVGPAGDSVLDDVATGPHDEALAVWRTAPRAAGGLDSAREQIMAARGVAEPPGVAVFSAPEAVAGPGRLAAPRAALDPANDNAVAVWQSMGAGIAYATRRPAAALRRSRPAAPTATDTGRGDWPPVVWALAALLALVSAASLERTRRARRAGRATGGTVCAAPAPPGPPPRLGQPRPRDTRARARARATA